MLELASTLDPNGIPQAVLCSPPAQAYLTQYRTRSTGSAANSPPPDTGRPVDAADAADALQCLTRLSLAELDPGARHRPVRVHNLIQRASRESLPASRRGLLARAAADAVLAAWPEIDRDTTLAQALRSSVGVLAGHAGAELWQPSGHPVLFHAGESLSDAGLIKAAQAYWQDIRVVAVRHLGPDHPDTLTTRLELARLRGVAGDPAGAAADLADVLADRVRVLGADHPSTLATRRRLAHWRGEAGDPTGAAAGYEELLADSLRVLGPDHPDTLDARAQRAHWRGKAGDPAGAVAAYEELLADELRVLSPDDWVALVTRGNLAYWRGKAGNAWRRHGLRGGAGRLRAGAWARQSQHPYQPKPPRSLPGRSGGSGGAAAAYEDLLADCLRVLGPDHPATLRADRNLAYWRGEAGDWASAVAAYEALLADCLRVLGPDHPETLDARQNLARWRGKAGDRLAP